MLFLFPTRILFVDLHTSFLNIRVGMHTSTNEFKTEFFQRTRRCKLAVILHSSKWHFVPDPTRCIVPLHYSITTNTAYLISIGYENIVSDQCSHSSVAQLYSFAIVNKIIILCGINLESVRDAIGVVVISSKIFKEFSLGEEKYILEINIIKL